MAAALSGSNSCLNGYCMGRRRGQERPEAEMRRNREVREVAFLVVVVAPIAKRVFHMAP